MSMITATTWVPRGYAAKFPTKYDFNEEEFDRIAQLAKLQLDDAQEELRHARKEIKGEPIAAKADLKFNHSNGDVDDDLKEYDLEHYDDDNDETSDADEGNTMGMFGNIKSLVYHDADEDDPYITMKEIDEEDEEREELQILATDNLVLTARIEDEVAHLEVYVYEDEADNLYVHHDIMLPAIPLAVEWLDTPVGALNAGERTSGNFVAVGTMDPDIELWDLDIVDCMYPNAILGRGRDEGTAEDTPSQEKKKRKRSKKSNDEYHVDSVLGLAANRKHRNLLASASADKTVKLWDLNALKCAKSYRYHTDKVCSLAWHPVESTVLLTGSYDRTVVAGDMRAPDQGTRTWRVDSDVETIKWNPHDPNYFYVSTEAGVLQQFDARIAPSPTGSSSAVWTLQAHDESVSSFDVNPTIPGFVVTGSTDKQVKLWNIQANGPSMVVSRDVGVGKVFSTVFAPDEEVGFRLAVAGSKGALQIWDTSTNAAVRQAFAGRVASREGPVEERLVGLAEDSGESEDEDSENDGGEEE